MSSKQYCIYLRKSRADVEIENATAEDVLERHEKILMELAHRQNLNIVKIHREVVSGETIVSRPKMQALLSEVEQGLWTGVLVMEVERLARGDTVDQGIVAQTFKYSDTKIITPAKTYDPNNEYDEEYFEFGLFMSRREYKTINRRLQRGRLSSVNDGKYVGNRPPYGYDRLKLEHEKGYTLVPNETEAPIVHLIFDWYTKGVPDDDSGAYTRLGIQRIARKLNEMHITPKRGKDWSPGSIRDILINPVYIGKIRWNWRPQHKKMTSGKITIERPRSDIDDCIIVDGLHPPIISDDLFQQAQEVISKNPLTRTNCRNIVKNPLAGLVVCGKCGRKMLRRSYTSGYADTLMCQATTCDNISSSLSLVEMKILDALRDWIDELKPIFEKQNSATQKNAVNVKKKALDKMKAELAKFQKQMDNIHDLLEQGVYDVNTFLDRSRSLSDRIEQVKSGISEMEMEISLDESREISRREIIPKVEHLLDIYNSLPTPKAKNDILKTVLDKVVYTKDKNGRWHNDPADFKIALYPKILK